MKWYKILLICIFDTDTTRYMSENISRYKIKILLKYLKYVSTVWVKKIPPLRGPDIFHFFFHKRLRIFNRLFTHLLYVHIHDRLQIFIQLSPILTKLCHIKRDYPVHIICSKCPQSAETHALTRLRKSLIALLIVVCGK